MEIRYIDSKPFVVTSQGKREAIRAPAEFKQAEQREIEESRARIAQLDTAIGAARQRLDAELIDGVDTSATRAEIAALDEEIHGFQRDIDEATRRIKQVDVLIDQHAAAGIQQADQTKLETLTAPFDRILEKNV